MGFLPSEELVIRGHRVKQGTQAEDWLWLWSALLDRIWQYEKAVKMNERAFDDLGGPLNQSALILRSGYAGVIQTYDVVIADLRSLADQILENVLKSDGYLGPD